MLNEKMEKVAHSIGSIIRREFPSDYLSLVFEKGRFEMSDIIIQIMVECCKYAYDTTAEKHSLLYYTREQNSDPNTEESEHKQISRTIEYINSHRDEYYYLLLEHGIRIDDLKSPEMHTMVEKLKGYKLTPFQFWEINDVHDNRIVKSIVDKKITKKNYSIDRFLEEEALYNSVLEDALKNIENGLDVVENFLKVFILESKYSLDFYYSISRYMMQNRINAIYNSRSRIATFCADSSLRSEYCESGIRILSYQYGITNNRMLRIRPNYINTIVLCNEEEYKKDVRYFNEGRYIVTNILYNMHYSDMPIREWFAKNTDRSDWETVIIEYDIHKVINLNKDWSNTKTIRYIKYIFKDLNNS